MARPALDRNLVRARIADTTLMGIEPMTFRSAALQRYITITPALRNWILRSFCSASKLVDPLLAPRPPGFVSPIGSAGNFSAVHLPCASPRPPIYPLEASHRAAPRAPAARSLNGTPKMLPLTRRPFYYAISWSQTRGVLTRCVFNELDASVRHSPFFFFFLLLRCMFNFFPDIRFDCSNIESWPVSIGPANFKTSH